VNLIKKTLIRLGAIVGTPVALLGPLAVHAQEDWTTSTTNAITAGQNAIVNQFFSVLPYVLGGVVAVTITLWGIRWVMSLFHGKRK